MSGEVPRFRSHVTLALCTLLHAFTHAYGTMLVPLYLAMEHDLGLPGVWAATLIVTIYGLVYCLGSYPAGVLADRRNRKALLGIGLIVNALAILLMGLTRRYELLVALGVLGGLAGTLFHPAANALSTAHYPKSPGMAIGVVSIGAAMGFFAGPLYAGWRGGTAGWQTPLVEAGLFGVAFGVAFLFVAKEVRVGGASASTSHEARLAEAGLGTDASLARGDAGVAATGSNGDVLPQAAVRSHPPMGSSLRWRMIAISTVLAGRDFTGIATLTLGSVYLQKARGLTVAQAGFILGAMMLIAVVANPLAVYFSGGRRRLPALFGILVAGGAVIACVPHVGVAYVLPVLCVFEAFHLSSYAVGEAAILERVAPAVRGRVIGIFITIAGTLASSSPWLMGAWTDAMGDAAGDPRSYALPFGVLGLLHVSAAGAVPLIRRVGATPTEQRVEPFTEISPQTLEVVG
jgi:MFS family permease